MIKYDKYKDSGIEWIGEIPEHWDVISLRRLTAEHKQGFYSTDSYIPEGTKLIRISDIDKDGNIDFANSPCVNITDNDRSYYALRVNDIIFPRTGSIGLFGLVRIDADAVFASYLIRFRFYSLVHPEYLKHYFKSPIFIVGILSDLHGGVNQNIHAENIKNQNICFPTFSEQTAIANYLDRKTADIDELIAKKEQLILLYEEEKTAIINQAVTGQLKIKNEKLKIKDSGIDWLGEIPEHWEVKKLKYVISKAGSGVTPKGGANVYQLSGIPLLRSQNIHFDGLKLDDVAYISKDIHNDMSNSKVQNGDVLLNITGASIGRCHFITNNFGEANVNQHVCIIRPKYEISTKFLFYILRSNLGQEQINQEQTGSGREGLNFESLKNFIVLSFDIEEQTAIVAHIEKETARIDAKIAKTKKLAALLKEYRSALISEVVTGKIKVTDENEL